MSNLGLRQAHEGLPECFSHPLVKLLIDERRAIFAAKQSVSTSVRSTPCLLTLDPGLLLRAALTALQP